MINKVTVRWWDGYLETFEATEVRFGCDLLWMRLANGKNRHITLRMVRWFGMSEESHEPEGKPNETCAEWRIPLNIDAVNMQPIVQPEAKRGRWLINSDGYYPYCSVCMKEPENGVMTDYCPNCGAEMKK